MTKPSHYAFKIPCLFVLAVASGTCFSSPTWAVTVIDDFDSPDPSSVFPLNDEPLGLSPSGEEPIDSDLESLSRFAFLAAGYGIPLPDPLPAGQSVTVALDVVSGTLSSLATSEASTFLLLGWGSSVESQSLDLDASQYPALQIQYNSNLETEARVVLSNTLNGSNERASSLDFLISAGNDTMVIPLSTIDETVLGDPQLVDGEIVREPLPPIDLTSVDLMSLSIGTVDATIVPLGLEFTLDRVALVPEPYSLVLMLGAAMTLLLHCVRAQNQTQKG